MATLVLPMVLPNVRGLSDEDWEPARQAQVRPPDGTLTGTDTGEQRSTDEAWIAATYDAWARLSRLEENWDSYGGQPIRREALLGVLNFLVHIDVAPLPLPAFVPMSNGGVQLEWHSNDIDLEVEVDGLNEGSFIWENNVTGECHEGDLSGAELSLLVKLVC